MRSLVKAPNSLFFRLFFFNDTATTEIYTLSLHDALPIYRNLDVRRGPGRNQSNSSVCGGSGRKRKMAARGGRHGRSEEHTSELQSRLHLVCRLLLEKKKTCRAGLLLGRTGRYLGRSLFNA